MKAITSSAGRSLSKISQSFLAITVTGLLVSFAPHASAAGEADGKYQITTISSSFANNGDPIQVPKQILKNALSKKGAIVITDNQIPVLRNKWVDVLNDFELFGTIESVKITGPRSLTLEPTAVGFSGSTERPVVVTITRDVFGLQLKADLRTTYTATLVGTTLTITTPVRVRTEGNVIATGTVKVVAEKL